MGDQFPIESEFYLDDKIDGMPGMVAIRDGSGRMYGSPVSAEMAPKVQPAVAALNGQTVEESIFQSNRTAIAEIKEEYSPEQVQTLHRLGRIALGPESLSYSTEAANYAGGTTVENGFIPNLSAEKVIEASIPRSKQTVSQRINVRRIKAGKNPTRRFALSEIRREIGKDVGRLAEYESGAFDVDTFRALPMPVQGKFAVIPERMNADGVMEASGETLFNRPPTKLERRLGFLSGLRKMRPVLREKLIWRRGARPSPVKILWVTQTSALKKCGSCLRQKTYPLTLILQRSRRLPLVLLETS